MFYCHGKCLIRLGHVCCSFDANTAAYGGAMHHVGNFSSLLIQGSTFAGNKALAAILPDAAGFQGGGGAIFTFVSAAWPETDSSALVVVLIKPCCLPRNAAGDEWRRRLSKGRIVMTVVRSVVWRAPRTRTR